LPGLEEDIIAVLGIGGLRIAEDEEDEGECKRGAWSHGDHRR
jgi:hypothetical protein